MRVIGYIEHPTLKITVFETDTRYPVQFEIVGYAQIYRFRRGDQLANLGDVRKLIDSEFCNHVAAEMLRMRQGENQLWQRFEAKYPNEKDELPSII